MYLRIPGPSIKGLTFLSSVRARRCGDVATAVSAGATDSERQVRATCSVHLAANSGHQAAGGAGRWGGQQGGNAGRGGPERALKFSKILDAQFSELILVPLCTINCWYKGNRNWYCSIRIYTVLLALCANSCTLFISSCPGENGKCKYAKDMSVGEG
jgi:hypothetical protein